MKNEEKIIVIAGLGLIGASLAKAFKKYTNHKVCGWNRTETVSQKALADNTIDAIADDEILAQCDILIPVLYPQSTIDYIIRTIPKLKSGAIIVDMVGVKKSVIDGVEQLALEHGVHFVGGHPMAGLPKTSYELSFAELYEGASMILVPTLATHDGDIEYLSKLFTQIKFGQIKITDKETHDKMIAHTSQLAHVVSNSYVKSPISGEYRGFAGGSYKDMTRIAGINEVVWTELFMLNKDDLIPEIEGLIANMNAIKETLISGDCDKLEEILKYGRECKENIENN